MENEKQILDKLYGLSEQMATVAINQSNIVNEVSNELKSLDVKFPDDYLTLVELHNETENLLNKLNIDKLKITARLPEGYLDEVRQTNKLLKEAKTSFDNLAQEKRKKRIVLNLNLPAKICIAVISAMILSIGGFLIYYVNTPAVLAQRMYLIKSQEDYVNPGWFYHETYEKVKNGERKSAKSEIKQEAAELAEYDKGRLAIEKLFEDKQFFVRNFAHNIEHGDTLVMFRCKDEDVIWKAYLNHKGSVFITDSDLVNTLYEARRYQYSKNVKWQKLR